MASERARGMFSPGMVPNNDIFLDGVDDDDV